jgi:hypothetical protein
MKQNRMIQSIMQHRNIDATGVILIHLLCVSALLLGCEPNRPPRPVPEPPPPSQSLSMLPPRWIALKNEGGAWIIDEGCGGPSPRFYIDKTLMGDPMLIYGKGAWRVGEIEGVYDLDTWTLHLDGAPQATLRWLDRPRGLAEWSGGPFEDKVVAVTGERESFIERRCPGSVPTAQP